MALWNSWQEYGATTSTLPRIDYLETMATFSCTLACKWCTNYSDYGMRGGYVRWDSLQSWLDILFKRLRIDCFGFIGGEPFLNPEFKDWVNNFRIRYPYMTLMIVTNGTLLDRNEWIIDAMREYGMIYLKITRHQPHLKYVQNFLDRIMQEFEWQQIDDKKWFNQDKILDLLIDESPTFTKTYRNEYGNMKPYNSNPEEAFSICTQQMCPLLLDGKLFKCSSNGLLRRVLGDHNQLDDQDWQKYLVPGLSLDCSDEELKAWVSNYKRPHAICSMCPTVGDDPFKSHYENVTARMNSLT